VAKVPLYKYNLPGQHREEEAAAISSENLHQNSQTKSSKKPISKNL